MINSSLDKDPTVSALSLPFSSFSFLFSSPSFPSSLSVREASFPVSLGCFACAFGSNLYSTSWLQKASDIRLLPHHILRKAVTKTHSAVQREGTHAESLVLFRLFDETRPLDLSTSLDFARVAIRL